MLLSETSQDPKRCNRGQRAGKPTVLSMEVWAWTLIEQMTAGRSQAMAAEEISCRIAATCVLLWTGDAAGIRCGSSE